MSYGGFAGYSRGITESEKRVARSPGKKHVFVNSMVAHVWANQSQSEGRSGNGNIYFDGPTIFSYGRHFPIAGFLDRALSDGRKVVAFNADSAQSPTTSQHIGDVRGALSGLVGVQVIQVPNLGGWINDYVDSRMAKRALGENGTDSFLETRVKRFKARHEAVFSWYRDAVGESEVKARKAADRDSPRYHDYYAQESVALRRDWQAYAEVFGLKTKLPKDCGRLILKRREEERKEKESSRVKAARRYAMAINARSPLYGINLTRSYRWNESSVPVLPIPGADSLTSYQVKERLERLESALKDSNTARHWLNRGHASKALKGRVSARIKALTTVRPAYDALASQVEVRERREADESTVKVIRAGLAPDASKSAKRDADSHLSSWRGPDFIARILAWESPPLDVVAAYYRAKSLAEWTREVNRGVTKPSWYYRTSLDTNGKRYATTEEKRAAWQNGERFTHLDSSLHFPTMLRRTGERLQTSRGAESPWQHAVLIFLKAQDCRLKVRTWKANGETFKAGSFQLDSIDSAGNVKIGCHDIQWGEMERLAVREVPQLVKARFPVPAIVSASQS